ncbi:GDP-fucose synthetase [Gordonia sp. CNJ-863]|uniref:GDP-L-fucose synthase family protein n=1 Tax=Gordonia sp. CNJ-863 TaxID=1904963 RepID=UPI000960D69C|nr:GDP-L-fucose synthase [Gordonia sp. CNJ-863]OLT48701.1 GDP-fucose synthetase [Gordonia sp. CNJ-863]
MTAVSTATWNTPLADDTKVYVAGHRGLVGSAVTRRLHGAGVTEVVGRSSSELDLRNREAVFDFFAAEKPDVVVLAAAKVGGIGANHANPVGFLSDNLRIQTNVLDAALEQRVQRLLFLGSSCIYPKFAEQPITESALLTGALEPTNDAYAIAKIAGIVAVQSVRRQHGLPWISAMPANLYGPGDNFDPDSSHLLPALIRRYSSAVEAGKPRVVNWGSGTPRRELLHVDDLAAAVLFLLENYNGDTHINVGTGIDHTIEEIARTVADAVGFTGETDWDTLRPDGTPRKVLNVSRLAELGWQATIPLSNGVLDTVEWYQQSKADPLHVETHRLRR